MIPKRSKLKIISKLNIRRLDLILAVFIFVFTAVNFYAFLYMSRECLRFFSITYDFDIWILTLDEVKFYNRFFAAVALIMGLGATSSFISNRPNYLNGSMRERTRTLNDSRVLNWVFMMWAVELGSVFGIYFIASQSFYEFSLYPEYRFLFFLFVIVLYLQQWTNFRRRFRSLTFKIFIPITLCFVILIFALGSINFIDYESLNQKVLSKNPYHKLEIIKPHSKSFTYTKRFSITRQLYLGKSRIGKSKDPKLMYEGGLEIGLNNIDSIVYEWKSTILDHQYPRLRFQLNIDESIPMKFVHELKGAVLMSQIFKLGYSVVPEGVSDKSQQRYKRNIIAVNVIDYGIIDSMYPDRLNGKKIIDITPKNSAYSIEGITQSKKEFREKIDSIIEESSDYHFNLVYDDDLTYGNFINTYSIIYGCIIDKRDQYSMVQYGKKYSWNTRQIQKEIRNLYPLSIEDSAYQNK